MHYFWKKVIETYVEGIDWYQTVFIFSLPLEKGLPRLGKKTTAAGARPETLDAPSSPGESQEPRKPATQRRAATGGHVSMQAWGSAYGVTGT